MSDLKKREGENKFKQVKTSTSAGTDNTATLCSAQSTAPLCS